MRPRIHYDTGKGHIQPISGKWTIVACGMWLQDSYEQHAGRKTKIPSLVTCKKCLKAMTKKKEQQ